MFLRDKPKLNAAFDSVKTLYEKQHYVCFDDLVDIAASNALSMSEINYLSDMSMSNGIIILDEAPAAGVNEGTYELLDSESPDKEEYTDYSLTDYEKIYNKVLTLAPQMESFISYVKSIRPPQNREVSTLKYQLAEGNRYTRQRMTEMYMRVAVKIALNRTEKYDLDIEDTIQDALTGLLIAVDNYKPDENGAFHSYASFWIIQNITRAQPVGNQFFYCPVHIKEVYYNIYEVLKQNNCLDDDNGIPGLREQLIKNCLKEKRTVSDYPFFQMILQLPFSIESLNDALENDSDYDSTIKSLYLDAISDYDPTSEVIDKIEHQQFEKKYISPLREKEQYIILHRYGFNDNNVMTLEDLGNEMGVTRERIRQIESKALKKIKIKLVLHQ